MNNKKKKIQLNNFTFKNDICRKHTICVENETKILNNNPN